MSNDTFILDERLKNDGVKLTDLKLSQVILVDNSLFPWIVLVPKKNDLKEIIDLSEQDRITLMEEISFISNVMKEIFAPDKLNVAALGNIVSQLHIHVIARYTNDSAWPNPVFGREKEPYTAAQREIIINKFLSFLEK
ncbi:MAG: HIT family protein [Sphingobacteriia bacterium]|nr:HIT family protein [Sphingobacteriia bacterium]